MRLQKAFALTLLTLSPLMASACDGVWTSGVSATNWNNMTNWTPSSCIPGAGGMAATDTATFKDGVQPFYTIALDINAGLSALTINSPNTAYEFHGSNGFFFNTASPSISINGGFDPGIQVYSHVASGSTLGINVASGSMVTFTQGAIANPAGAFNLNYTGSGQFIFEWNGSGPFATSTIDLGGGNFTVQNGPFLIENNNVPHAGVPHGTAVSNFNTGTISSGSLAVQNSANVNFNNAPRATGASFTGNTLSLNSGSTFSFGNSGAITGTANEDIGSYAFLNSLSNQDGSIIMTNSGSVTTGGVGNELAINPGPLNVSRGSLSMINTGTISTNGAGNLLDILFGSLVVDSSTFSVTNAGSTSDLGIGNTVAAKDAVFTNSSVTFKNEFNADITRAIGLFLDVFNNMTIDGGTFQAINNGTILSNGGDSVGVDMGVANILTLNGGTFTLINFGNVKAPTLAGKFGVGSGMEVQQNFILNSGSVSLQNFGSVGTSSFGTLFEVDQNLIMNGGSLSIFSGLDPAGGTGSLFKVGGSATLNGGLLTNNGFFFSPTLNIGSAATVSGAGTFSNPGGNIIVTNAGTLKPGSPTGMMTIQGNYIQTPAGNFVASFASPSSFSQLNVGGTAQLGGTLTTELVSNGKISSQKYTILNASGGVSGQFNNLISNFALQPHLEYLPSSVLLFFTLPDPQVPNFVESLFSTVNHINGRIERQMSQLRRRFPSLQSDRSYPKPRELLVDNSPTIAASPQIEEKQEQLKRRLEPTDCCCDGSWSVYLGPKGDVGRVLTKNKNPGFHYNNIGAEAGFDYAFSRLGIGFITDYDHLHGRVAHKWGSFNINQAHASVYATYVRRAEHRLAFNMVLGGGYDWYHIHRRTPGGVANGNPRGSEYDALGGLEYTIEGEKGCVHWEIVPLINLQYIHAQVKSYQEYGAPGFNLSYGCQKVQSLRSQLGLRMNATYEWTNTTFIPEINVGWQREYEDRKRHVGIAFAGLANRALVAQPGRNTALAGLDLLWTFFDKYGFEASYDFEWNKVYLDHFFYLGCNFKF